MHHWCHVVIYPNQTVSILNSDAHNCEKELIIRMLQCKIPFLESSLRMWLCTKGSDTVSWMFTCECDILRLWGVPQTTNILQFRWKGNNIAPNGNSVIANSSTHFGHVLISTPKQQLLFGQIRKVQLLVSSSCCISMLKGCMSIAVHTRNRSVVVHPLNNSDV